MNNATINQINWLWWKIEDNGKSPFDDHSQTLKRIYQELPAPDRYGFFVEKMKHATTSQASYLIQLIDQSKYPRVIRIFKQLGVVAEKECDCGDYQPSFASDHCKNCGGVPVTKIAEQAGVNVAYEYSH